MPEDARMLGFPFRLNTDASQIQDWSIGEISVLGAAGRAGRGLSDNQFPSATRAQRRAGISGQEFERGVRTGRQGKPAAALAAIAIK
jgi:hypothetical protein